MTKEIKTIFEMTNYEDFFNAILKEFLILNDNVLNKYFNIRISRFDSYIFHLFYKDIKITIGEGLKIDIGGNTYRYNSYQEDIESIKCKTIFEGLKPKFKEALTLYYEKSDDYWYKEKLPNGRTRAEDLDFKESKNRIKLETEKKKAEKEALELLQKYL